MRQPKSFLARSLNEDRRVFGKLFGLLGDHLRGPSTVALPASKDPLSLGQAAEEDGDIVEAERLYNLAAQSGSARALYHIGNLFASGIGRPRDIRKAERWYQQAAQKGDAYALHDLAMWNYFGIEQPVNIKEAARLYQKSAEQGFEPAQDQLFAVYRAHPELATEDGPNILARCQKAAEGGSTTAILYLAEAYRRAQWGAERDAAEALRLYQLAGEKGAGSAYYELGTMFEEGDGVPQNYPKARHCYERATQRSCVPPAYQSRLANLMQNMGNKPEAHAWYNLASANELATAEQKTQYIEARDALARTMTPDQVAEAHLLAEKKFENPDGSSSNSTPEIESDGRRSPPSRWRNHSSTNFLTGVLVGSLIADDSSASTSSSADTTSYDAPEGDFEGGGGDFGGGGSGGDYGGDSGGD